MKKIDNILWGTALIILGIIWALNTLGITNINVFFTGWWTLFIIVPCFIGLFKDDHKTGNIIGLTIGSALLLASNDILDFDLLFKLMIPFILICIGISIIFKDTINKKMHERIKQLNKEGLEEYYATFGGQRIDLSNEEFKGCSLNAIFGGIELDLKGSIVKEEKIINASAIFGGVEITVPSNVNVKVKSTPIFGGVSNKISNKKDENIPTIYINALCLFGGVDIK